MILQRNTKAAIFILPTIFFYVIFMTLTILPWYTGIILAMAEFFGMHHVSPSNSASSYTIDNTSDRNSRTSQQKHIYRQYQPKPLFCGNHFSIYGMGCILLGYKTCAPYVYFFPIAYNLESYKENTETQSHAFSHLLFALAIGLCAYNFFRAITLDPGTCPKPSSDAELKTVWP